MPDRGFLHRDAVVISFLRAIQWC